VSTFSTRKKRAVAAVAAIAIVGVGGALAYGYWSSAGTGTGSATTGTSSAFTVASSAPTGGPLSPGGPTETVPFVVTNSGSGNQNLTSVVVTVASAGGAAWSLPGGLGCSALDYTVGTPVITYGAIAPAGTAVGTVTLTMKNLATNQDTCKGASVPLYFVAS
jgi:hypothetical protein